MFLCLCLCRKCVSGFMATAMAMKRFYTLRRSCRMVVAVFCVCLLYWLFTKFSRIFARRETVFGSHDVIIASSANLNTWLSLKSRRPCKDHEERTLMFRYIDVKLVCKNANETCYVWYWDVANWTLIYTHESMSTNTSRFCPIPIHGERTAKIIQSDGNVEYPGCAIEKDQCAPKPIFYASYDHNVKQRINRSPCCRKLLVDITQHMGRVFDKYNITYFLVGGPVISLVRDDGVFIPYDTDTDVAVDANDYDKVNQSIPELQEPGYIFKWLPEKAKGDKRYMVGCTNKHCRTGPGIALYTVEEEMIASVANWPSLPANLTIPPIRRIFEGMEMGFPKEPEKYLDYNYGKDKWRAPLKCTKHYEGQCSQ